MSSPHVYGHNFFQSFERRGGSCLTRLAPTLASPCPSTLKMSTHMSTITSPGTVMAALPQNNPALEALQAYKQRDLSKGTRGFHNSRYSRPDSRRLCSRSEIQSSRKCSYYEAELLQNYSVKPLPGCRPIPTERAWLESV